MPRPADTHPLPARHVPARLPILLGALLGLAAGAPSRAADAPGALPPAVASALMQAKVAPAAFALWVQPVDGATPTWSANADAPFNPASVFKLATTAAALDQLGPAWSWQTPVSFTGPVEHGVLHGSVVIHGVGDPSLVMERVWLLLRRVRDAGVRDIDGDIVLDHEAFAPVSRSPADFDGAPQEPYNVQPDALMLNFKSIVLSITPDPAAHVARISYEPPLEGFAVDATVPLARGACEDWHTRLEASLDDPRQWRFKGAYPASCGVRNWPLAYPDPAAYDARLVAALWKEVGGHLVGSVRDGPGAPDPVPAFQFASPPLAEVVRDINKFSNNVMAEQVFLTLPRVAAGSTGAATQDAGRDALAQWLHGRLGAVADGAVIANGSGLSRETRVSAHMLGALLQWIWRSPVMPELVSSLPLNGVDGTLRHGGATPGRAHLKTGSMRDVAAIAGYVLADDGRRYILVAMVNDPNAAAARPALDAAVDWVMHAPPIAPVRAAGP